MAVPYVVIQRNNPGNPDAPRKFYAQAKSAGGLFKNTYLCGWLKIKKYINAMEAISYTDLRQNLNAYMDRVIQNRVSLIVTRKNSENVVLISNDEYNSLIETNYLLSNGANAEHLKKSIAQHKAGKIKERALYEYE